MLINSKYNEIRKYIVQLIIIESDILSYKRRYNRISENVKHLKQKILKIKNRQKKY